MLLFIHPIIYAVNEYLLSCIEIWEYSTRHYARHGTLKCWYSSQGTYSLREGSSYNKVQQVHRMLVRFKGRSDLFHLESLYRDGDS